MLRGWMLTLLFLSPLCGMAALMAASTPAADKKTVIQSTPGGPATLVTGGPVVRVENYSPTPTAAPRWCVVDTGGLVLMVRSTPDLDPGFVNRLGSVFQGDRLQVLGMTRKIGKGITTWYHVRVPADANGPEYEGWVAGMYCKFEEGADGS
jgi:hypothetical protein